MRKPLTGCLASCLFAVLMTTTACNNEEIGSSKDVSPESIYFDYNFTGSEEGQDITLKLQYRFGGSEGTTLVLEPPSQVTVDGQPVPVDSSGTDGAYYEVIRPTAEFTGPHTIVFTSADGKTYKETVEFPMFRLASVPDTIDRSGLQIPLEGLNSSDYVQVLLTDTAAYSKGIDRLDSVNEGQISISATELSVLKPGPINLQIIRQRQLPLKQTTPEGGRLHVSYSASREIFIRE